MATPNDVAQVRLNTNEPFNVAPYTDDYIGALIDAAGVVGATASVWESKAASIAATAVDVTEADATHKMSDRFDHANSMIRYWRAMNTDIALGSNPGVRVRVIERS